MAIQARVGNLLGATQAEADEQMLSQAFIETADYEALRHTTDFSYVVGRRGTGKSALYQRLKEVFVADSGVILILEEPQDYEMLALHNLIAPLSSEYRVLRAISRVAWTINFLLKSAIEVAKHYRFDKSPDSFFLTDYLATHQPLISESGASNCNQIIRGGLKEGVAPGELSNTLATQFQISKVTQALKKALDETGLRIVTLCDRLDEAWVPEMTPVAILGGLAKMAADYREKHFPFYPLLFIRDNMFRVLAQFDDDFTRHIEGHSLRLQWDEATLFHLVAARLRVALNVENVNDVKVWNRFAYRDLHDREGFSKCLRYTLFRPRDILVLLNEAYINARREGRDAIIEKDIDKSAINISQHRLEDLCKEYDKVLPGVRLFVSSFREQPAKRTFQAVVDSLQYVADHNDYSEIASRELALFESGGEMFAALYSIGFIGLQNSITGNYAFCHDGTQAALVSIDASRETLVHPCYWKALDVSVSSDSDSDSLLIQVNDEYAVPLSNEPAELRLQRLGRLPEELAGIPPGHDGSRAFEVWVARAVKLLFSGSLRNIELKPNPYNALNQRDVVATNATTSTFWRRIYEDYGSRQIIFECKNYEELTPDDFRQLLDYSTGEYGHFAIAVRRGKHDFLTENEKARTRALFHEHKRLFLIVPTPVFGLCIRKLRTRKKYDYAEYTMSAYMDRIVRTGLSLTHAPRYKQKRKK